MQIDTSNKIQKMFIAGPSRQKEYWPIIDNTQIIAITIAKIHLQS